MNGQLIVIVGGFYGDEGKGKIASFLAHNRNVEAVARAGVGTNAGHTVVHDGITYRLRSLPSGFTAADAKLYIGAGVYINEEILLDEIERTGTAGRLFLDHHTGVITEDHIRRETESTHLTQTVGTTKSGSGAAGVDRVLRILTVAKDYTTLKGLTGNVSDAINDILDNDGTVIVEGSQATFLSVYHGSYPYTTSKDVGAAAAVSDIGVGPTRVTDVVVVFKAFVTRVGEGYLKDELSFEEAKERGWDEYGTVTGRPRRAAPFDYELARKACRLNGATQLALTKMDIVFPELEGAVHIDQISERAWDFIKKVEQETGVKVVFVSTGPGSTELIELS